MARVCANCVIQVYMNLGSISPGLSPLLGRRFSFKSLVYIQLWVWVLQPQPDTGPGLDTST